MSCLPTYKGVRYSNMVALKAFIIKEAQESKPLNTDQLNNKILDLQLSILTNQYHEAEMLEPLSSALLEEQIKRIGKAKRKFDHISSLHTNIYYEYINKFAKQAVGITATYITGQTMYARAGVKGALDLVKIIQEDKQEGKPVAGSFTGTHNSDNILVSDILKAWNNAALDNAKDPLLGHLNITEHTINTAMLLSSMGYSLNTVEDILDYPLIREFSKFASEHPDTGPTAMINEFLETNPALKTSYIALRKSEFPGTLTQQDLSNKDLPIGKEALLFYVFNEASEAGRDLAKINKLLSPETAKDLSTFSAVEEFDNIIKYFASKESTLEIDEDIFSINNRGLTAEEKINNSPVPRVTAFYEYGLQGITKFSRELFPYATDAYEIIKDRIARLIGARSHILPKDTVDIINSKLGLLLLTADNKLAEALLKGTDVNKLMFDKEASLAARLVKLKPKLKNKLLSKFTAAPSNPNTQVQHIKFNNTAEKSVDEKNLLTQAWLDLFRSPSAEVRAFAKDLVTYSVLTSGFSTGPGTFFDLIPSEFFIDSGLVKHWESVTKQLADPGFLSQSADVVVRQAFKDIVTSLPSIITDEGISESLTKVVTSEAKNPVKGTVIYRAEGKTNLVIESFEVNLDSVPAAQVQGFKVPKGEYKQAKPYLKIYTPIKKVTRSNKSNVIVKSLSDYRLYRLEKQQQNIAKYVQVQPLGDKGQMLEGNINNPLKKSLLNKWKGITPGGPPMFQLTGDTTVDYTSDTNKSDAEILSSLQGFLQKMGIRVEAIESIIERFGVDAKGAADLVNSVIYLLNTPEGMQALPEEVSHFFVESLADEKFMQRLLDKVENTPEYKEVVKQYGELYNNDINKLKREAAAKLIAKHLIKKEPVTKNWLRDILDNIKELINKIFKNQDPFRQAAQYILNANTEMLANAPLNSGVMFHLDKDFDIQNVKGESGQMKVRGESGRISEADIKWWNEFSQDAKEVSHWRSQNLSFTKDAIKNLKATFDKQALKVAEVTDKIKRGIESKILNLKARGVSIPEELKELQDSLDKLDGINFLKNLGKNATDLTAGLSESFYKFDWANTTPEHSLGFLYKLESQLGSFEHMLDLIKILEAKQREEKDDNLIPVIVSLKTATMNVQMLSGIIEDQRHALAGKWIKDNSTQNMSDPEIERLLKEVTTRTGFVTGMLDRWGLSLADSMDPILSLVAKKIKNIETMARGFFSDYIRGAKGNPGLAKLTIDLQKFKNTTNLEELYDDFIFWHPKERRYKFIVDPDEIFGKSSTEKKSGYYYDKWKKLQALPKDHPVRKFYDLGVEPYLNARRRLTKNNMKNVIGDFNNVPVRRKQADELTLGSKDWAMTKLQNIKDDFRLLPDEDFLGALDETGTPIHYVPYRYNYMGDLKQEEVSMEIANGLALAMQNIYEADLKREALPLFEAFEKILSKREFKKTQGAKVGTDLTQSGTSSDSYQKYDTLMRALIYGEEEGQSTFLGQDIRKLSRTAKALLSFLNLGFNLPSQIVNPLVQTALVLQNSIGSVDYSLKDLKKGYGKAMSKMAGMLQDYQAKAPKSKDTLLMERLGIFSHGLEDVNLGRTDNFINNFMVKLGYAGFKIGNAMVQPGVAYAMMSQKKFKLSTGKEVTFDEAWEIKDGTLALNPEVMKEMGGLEKVEQYLAKISEVIRLTSDNHHLSDKGAAEAHWVGKFIMMHRGWMMPMFMNVFSQHHYNETLGRWQEGTIRTSINALRKVFNPENILQWKNLAFQFGNLSTKDVNPSTGKPFTEEELALYKANIQKSVTMFYSWVLLTTLKAFAWDDEEKKDSYTYYFTLRVKAELFTLLDPADTLRVLQSPTAAVNNMVNLIDLVGNTIYFPEGLEVIERGPYKDWTKMGRAWSRFTPVYNQYMSWQKIEDKIKWMEQ